MPSIPSVSVFSGYPQDRRLSMRIYSEHLVAGLRAQLPGACIHEIVPSAPQWTEKSPQAMRLLRYLIYPWQARSKNSSINHITEPGYAHLIRFLDSSKTIVNVHDLIPLLSWRGLIPGLSYPHTPRLLKVSLSYVKKAACIVTPSETVKRDVIKYCKCREDNVHVVHYGIDKCFRPFSPDQRLEQRRRLGLPLDDHLILITGHQAYKNHGACFRAVEKLRQTLRRQVRIVRMGDCSKMWAKEYGRICHDDTVIDLGFLSPDLTPSVYNAVDSLLFPSLYEGFGWPPLEAMACGVPVVASNAGSLPEIIGNAGHLCAPDDVVTLAEGLRDVLDNAQSRSDLIAKGHQRAKQFTWERHIEHICKFYNGLNAGECP